MHKDNPIISQGDAKKASDKTYDRLYGKVRCNVCGLGLYKDKYCTYSKCPEYIEDC